MNKLVVLCACVLLFAAYVNATATEVNVGAKSSAIAKAGGLKEWVMKRAKKFIDKIKSLIAKLKIVWPFNDKGQYVDAKGKVVDDVDEKTANDAIDAAFGGISKAPDTEFKPDAQELQTSSPDDNHVHAALEAADGMIDPADTLGNDPDGQTCVETAENSGGSQEDALMGLAGKALVRADCAASQTPEVPIAPADQDSQDGEDVSLLESHATAKIRTRRRGIMDYVKKASSAFLAILKGAKHLIPTAVSAGIGGNAGPLAFSADLGVDLAAETMGLVLCYGGLFGTDSIGVAVNYHIQVGWYGSELIEKREKKQEIKFDDMWAGLSVGVTASVGFTAANIPLSVGAAISWGASKLEDAWKEFKEKITAIHSQDKTIVEGAGTGDASINLKNLASKAKGGLQKLVADAVAAKDFLIKGALGVLPNVREPIVANIAIGTGISPATLAAGGDLMINKCVTKLAASKVKLWKMLLGLFLVSGPPGAIVGLFSWLTYHADVVAAALNKLKGKLIKVGQAAVTFAKGIKNFWIGRVVPATKEVLAALQKDAKDLAGKLTNAVSKSAAKITYFFAEGNFLKNMVSKLKDKLKSVFSSVKDKLKNLFTSKKKKMMM